MNTSERINRLGTETAFKVSGEATAFASEGNRVFPFHLGDMNIPTPQNITDAIFKAIKNGKTGYCPAAGIPELREALAQDLNHSHGTNYTANNVSIQPGGKPVIGKFILALMNHGDEVLYPNPGYPIYESQIEFHGGKAVPYTFEEGTENFTLDVDAIEELITPKTKILVFNNLQNPSGAESTEEELKKLAQLANKYNLWVLSDEAYFDIRYSGNSQSIASFPGMQERTVILYTFSKKYAMTGWRLGAALGPAELIDVISKINVNHESCTTHFIQHGGVEALTGDPSGAQAILKTLEKRRDLAVSLLNKIEGVKCFKPHATFYLYPNVTEAMSNLGINDYHDFRRSVLENTGVSFCTRIHFGRELENEKQKYIRLAYSGIDVDDIEEGLGRLKSFLEQDKVLVK